MTLRDLIHALASPGMKGVTSETIVVVEDAGGLQFAVVDCTLARGKIVFETDGDFTDYYAGNDDHSLHAA